MCEYNCIDKNACPNCAYNYGYQDYLEYMTEEEIYAIDKAWEESFL